MAMEARGQRGVATGTMQIEVVLPSQYYGPQRKQAPEQRLMIAVLHDALDCVEKYRSAKDGSGRRLYHEAKQWFLADDSDWPCSFEHICGVLDLDASAVRQRLALESAPVCQAQPPVTPEPSNGWDEV